MYIHDVAYCLSHNKTCSAKYSSLVGLPVAVRTAEFYLCVVFLHIVLFSLCVPQILICHSFVPNLCFITGQAKNV